MTFDQENVRKDRDRGARNWDVLVLDHMTLTLIPAYESYLPRFTESSLVYSCTQIN